MEQTTLDSSPLTMGELSELLNRHIENALIATIIKDAMQRRLADVHDGPPQHEEEHVSLPVTCG